MSPPRPPIDYGLFGRAFDYYQDLGYTYVEVPYCVPLDIIRLTLPPQYIPDEVLGLGFLVGSAEQSLLSLDLPDGSYMAVSPCFRPEPVLNERYQRHFMKVELFQLGPVEMNPMAMLKDARTFMSDHVRDDVDVDIVGTDQGWDIEINGIEVGSYGFREAGGRKWACGTGLALPRFDVARNFTTAGDQNGRAANSRTA
jgi:hypothetical protein